MFIVSAKITVQESTVDRCIEGLKAILPGVSNELGAITYDILQSKEYRNQFMVYEVYADESAFQVHLDSEHYKTLIETVGGLLECPPVLEMWDSIGSIQR